MAPRTGVYYLFPASDKARHKWPKTIGTSSKIPKTRENLPRQLFYVKHLSGREYRIYNYDLSHILKAINFFGITSHSFTDILNVPDVTDDSVTWDITYKRESAYGARLYKVENTSVMETWGEFEFVYIGESEYA